MGEMIVAHDIRHGLNANQKIRADGLRRRDTIDHGAKDLVVVNNNAGTGDVGLAALIRRRRVRKDDLLVSAFVRSARVP